MNVNTDPASMPDADNDADTGSNELSATAAPKRAPRKRAAKPAEAVVDPALVDDTGAEPAPAAKSPRRRKPAASVEAGTTGATAEPTQVELPLQPASVVEAQVTEPTSLVHTKVADAVADLASDGAGSEGTSASGDVADRSGGSEGEGEGESEGGTPSERSRRRSRRDRRRNRQEAGAEDPAGAVDSDSAEGEPDDERVAASPAVPPPLPEEVFAQVVSGEFDQSAEVEPVAEGSEPSESAAQPPKRVLRPEPDAPKLHKVLAQSGIGSRRDMEQAITDGLVTVNGQVAHIGQRISFGDRIQLNGKPVRVRIVPPAPRIIAYHKPVGEVVTTDDPEHRPTVFRRLPRLVQGKWQSVGRLDLNTEGLLLFTNSGELANQLMHPRFGVEREYAVRVLGQLDGQSKQQLLEGVNIDGQTAMFRSIEDGGGEGVNHWYRVVITEGRNREVRKLFDAVELTVSRLIRIRYGTVVLPRGLKRGVWVDLEPEDVKAIRRLANPGGEVRERNDGPRDAPRGQNNQTNAQPRDRNNKPRNDRRPEGGPRPDRGVDRGPRPSQPQPQNQAARPPRNLDNPPAQRARSNEPYDFDEDEEIDHSRIPNPLEQTFDKRFVQNPRSPAGGRGFRDGGGGFGSGGSARPPAKKGSPAEPDPLQTSVGYIGANAFHKKGGRGGGFGGGGGGFNRGGGGGRKGR